MTNLSLNGSLASIAPTASSQTSPSSQSSSASIGSASGLTQADFIKLIVAQMQNQDPTQPMNPQNLATEFSNMATVNGIDTLDSKVSQIQAGAAAAQMAQAAGLVGKTVAVSGDGIITNGSGSTTGAFSLSATAASAVISITDPTTGNVVGHVTLSNLPSGLNDFSWSGGAANKAYRYQVAATDAAGNAVQATTYASGVVNAVNLSGSAPTISLSGQTAPIALSKVESIIGA